MSMLYALLNFKFTVYYHGHLHLLIVPVITSKNITIIKFHMENISSKNYNEHVK